MLQGKKIVLLAEEGFEDSELMEPLRAMKNAEARVTIVGSGSQETYQGKRGSFTVTVDTTADKVKINNFDAVIVPGGQAPAKMRLNQPMVDLVKQAYKAGKLIAAICHGPQLLITAGIVKGRRMTSYPAVADELKEAGAEYVDEQVVRDGNLITSRKPADLPAFDKAIIEALQN